MIIRHVKSFYLTKSKYAKYITFFTIYPSPAKIRSNKTKEINKSKKQKIKNKKNKNKMTIMQCLKVDFYRCNI